MVREHIPPGPRALWIVQSARLYRDPLGYQQRQAHRFGDLFTLSVPPLGQLVVIADPEIALEVTRGDPARFRAGEANGQILPILDCGSLLLSDEDEHRRRRQVLMPAFHGAAIARLQDTMRRATEGALASWPAGRPVRLLPSLKAITLEVILRAVIAPPDPARATEMAAAVRRMLGPLSAAALWTSRNRRSWLSPARIFDRRQAAVHALVIAELDRRRAAGRGAPGDALDLLLAASDDRGEPLPDRAICDEVVSLLIAGHETTSVALAWAFERLARHPDVAARLRTELADGDETYLGAIVAESLRARPPLVDVVRRLRNATPVGGHLLPAGTTVMASIPLIHHRADLHPDPDVFRPERFLDARPSAREWLPFGGGVRRCIGADLATAEMRTVLATVLRYADLSADTAGEPARLVGTALRPARGARVIISHRQATPPASG